MEKNQQSRAANRDSPWLKRVRVSGFQGNRSITLPLDRRINFLIGRNGCGKTTLINLINAGLTGDVAALLSARFETLELTFGQSREPRTFVFEYTRSFDRERGEIEVSFQLLGARRKVLERRLLRERGALGVNRLRGLFHEAPVDHIKQVLDSQDIASPVSTWLSIHRGELQPINALTIGETATLSPIDRKIEELVNRTARYLSALDSRASDLSAEFQKEYYLSIVGERRNRPINDMYKDARKLDLSSEREALNKILLHLQLSESDYRDRLDRLFSNSNRIVSAGTKNQSYLVDDVLTIVDLLRVHDLNEKWLRFEKSRSQIYDPKTKFIEIVNSHFIDKTLSYDDRNQPIFHIGPRRTVKPSELSSGEKQAFVILSEALVQESRTAIYFADEPELSMHVEWQQYLVQNIMDLNPNCQIVFATHSPDILGEFGDHAFVLEAAA